MKNFSPLIYSLLIISFSALSCTSEDPSPVDPNDPVNLKSQYPDGSIFGPEGPTKIVDVTNPKTGKTWMDRNLGASRAATSSTDALSYGDLYQWGRSSDGHQLRISTIIATRSTTDKPENSNFIKAPGQQNDWRSTPNDNLWQGKNGINNPCPKGYRLPTLAELDAERLSWSSQTNVGAFASPLKWTMGGWRWNGDGFLSKVGFAGSYWSSTVVGSNARSLDFFDSDAYFSGSARALGLCVRCIKD
jgi:hypothetical protein